MNLELEAYEGELRELRRNHRARTAAVLAEREECAKVAERYLSGFDHPKDPEARVRNAIATLIRGRSTKAREE